MKATHTASALEQLRGMISEANERLVSHPTERLNYISHGVILRKSFEIKHTGLAATSLSD
ncbi:uncharacterized protein N7479_010090 [Penicillium vulpinum]|uniref:uncharacterized protein n=1 Tax=Penicillium vulpinum TaxID=29845 RepID=UPI002547E95D|nr:uncharacterized protein N7479_010090 [Penicillium vulpinum]KAJ5951677.1 hypothetical protein N7479_010090 [Penicillium vulpinum]